MCILEPDPVAMSVPELTQIDWSALEWVPAYNPIPKVLCLPLVSENLEESLIPTSCLALPSLLVQSSHFLHHLLWFHPATAYSAGLVQPHGSSVLAIAIAFLGFALLISYT